MSNEQKYRRKFDGAIVTAFQYGEGKPWDEQTLSRLAAFVTGVDVDRHTSMDAERVLDVIKPVLTDWDATRGRTPIEVADVSSHSTSTIDLGDWVVKPNRGPLVFVSKKEFPEQYEPVRVSGDGQYMSEVELQAEELSDFIYDKCMKHLDGELYQALAENIANKLVKAGWRKEKP